MTSYDGIEALGLQRDMQSWDSCKSPLFAKFIDETKPKNIIEVGSWKGVSACIMAELSAPYGSKIHCVDTWLGDVQHVLGKDKLPRDQWGYPQLFHQFLVNVKGAGYSERITPYPMCSVDGWRYLKHLGLRAELIYVDGGHDMETVYQDCKMYWDLLEPGGIMFLDDTLVFPTVFAGAIRFACEFNADMKTEDPFSYFRKPSSTPSAGSASA